MPVDENGNAFYEESHSEPDMHKTESVKLEDGSFAHRDVIIQGKTTVTRKKPEEMGWFKKGEWLEIIQKTVFRPVANSEDFERVTTITLMRYSVDVEKCPCQWCTGQDRNYDYLKFAPSLGLIRRCFKADQSHGFLSAQNKNAFKFLGSKSISKAEARDLIMSQKAWCGDFEVRKILGIPSNL